MEEKKKQEPRLTSAWVRLGTIMRFTEEELKAIADGKPISFARMMQEGRVSVDGNSYVPETTLCWDNENDRHFCESVGMNGDNEINDFEIDFEPWQPCQQE